LIVDQSFSTEYKPPDLSLGSTQNPKSKIRWVVPNNKQQSSNNQLETPKFGKFYQKDIDFETLQGITRVYILLCCYSLEL